MGDAPLCDVCGHITIRNGSCYKCLNCGNSLGAADRASAEREGPAVRRCCSTAITRSWRRSETRAGAGRALDAVDRGRPVHHDRPPRGSLPGRERVAGPIGRPGRAASQRRLLVSRRVEHVPRDQGPRFPPASPPRFRDGHRRAARVRGPFRFARGDRSLRRGRHAMAHHRVGDPAFRDVPTGGRRGHQRPRAIPDLAQPATAVEDGPGALLDAVGRGDPHGGCRGRLGDGGRHRRRPRRASRSSSAARLVGDHTPARTSPSG